MKFVSSFCGSISNFSAGISHIMVSCYGQCNKRCPFGLIILCVPCSCNGMVATAMVRSGTSHCISSRVSSSYHTCAKE
jgi:hypothetical protein